MNHWTQLTLTCRDPAFPVDDHMLPKLLDSAHDTAKLSGSALEHVTVFCRRGWPEDRVEYRLLRGKR